MKTYLALSLLLWLAACSSPATKNTSQTLTPKQDSALITVAEAATSTLMDKEKEYLNSLEDHIIIPPYGRDKVKALVGKLKYVEDPEGGDVGSKALDQKTYASLSFNEKFTYHMIHPESFSQNCDILPAQPKQDERIYGSLTDIFGEYDWSERQMDFFKNNRDSVTKLMKSLIEEKRFVGENFKEVIVDINATEMIPYLINTYNRNKSDHYILTVLLLLMKENKYPEFVNSTGYKKLYGDRTSEDYENAPHLVYNKANEDLIIQRATNFYNGLQAK